MEGADTRFPGMPGCLPAGITERSAKGTISLAYRPDTWPGKAADHASTTLAKVRSTSWNALSSEGSNASAADWRSSTASMSKTDAISRLSPADTPCARKASSRPSETT